MNIAELIARYWKHVEEYYRHADGTPTGEVQGMRYALRPLHHLDGSMPAAEFGPAALKAIRELMIHGYEHPKYGPQKAICRSGNRSAGFVTWRSCQFLRLLEYGDGSVLLSWMSAA